MIEDDARPGPLHEYLCIRHCLHMRIMLDKCTLVLSDSAPTLQCTVPVPVCEHV